MAASTPGPNSLGTDVRQLSYESSVLVTLLNVQMIGREKLDFVAWAPSLLRPLVLGFCIAGSTRTLWN